MVRFILCLTLLTLAIAAAPLAASEPVPAAYDDLVHARDWREAAAASQQLRELGAAALPALLEGTTHHQAQVRRHCFEILLDTFSAEPAAIEAVILELRGDSDDRDDLAIRYRCAFSAGSHKIAPAVDALRELYRKGTKLKLTAAKSLAELGDPEGFAALYHALGSEWYMERYQANLGIKALTGRDMKDFGHDWGEGAFVSGGVEARRIGTTVADAEKVASRYTAIAKFHRWLDDNRPELSELLNPPSKSMREKARLRKERAAGAKSKP